MSLFPKLAQLRPLNAFITPTITHYSKPELNRFTYAVKDVFCTKGIRTTCASRALAEHVPAYNAAVIDRLDAAGGRMIGKTNSDEFSIGTASTSSAYGCVKSPYSMRVVADLERDWLVPGGSSGGSAVAVAVQLCDVALGSDTGGSTRNPAAHCGVVGLKPSYGRVSEHRALLHNAVCRSVVTVSCPSSTAWTSSASWRATSPLPRARSVRCPTLMHATQGIADILSGHDMRDGTSLPSTDNVEPRLRDDDVIDDIRIGIPNEYRTAALTEHMYAAWSSTADLLADTAKCRVHAVSMPHTAHSLLVYHVLGECDVASNMARYDGVEYGARSTGEHASVNELYAASRLLAFGEVVRRRILVGNYFLLKEHYDTYFVRATQLRRLIADDFRAVFAEVDVLLTPVTSDTAPLYSTLTAAAYDRERSDDYFTQPVNMAGVCALSLPVGVSAAGLPMGMQLIAAAGREDVLLRTAQWLERRVAFPPLSQQTVIDDCRPYL